MRTDLIPKDANTNTLSRLLTSGYQRGSPNYLVIGFTEADGAVTTFAVVTGVIGAQLCRSLF